VIDLESSAAQLNRNPSIAITAFILGTDLLDLLSFISMFERFIEPIQVIIIAASRDFRYYQKQF
jgi:hypothetical protein